MLKAHKAFYYSDDKWTPALDHGQGFRGELEEYEWERIRSEYQHLAVAKLVTRGVPLDGVKSQRRHTHPSLRSRSQRCDRLREQTADCNQQRGENRDWNCSAPRLPAGRR